MTTIRSVCIILLSGFLAACCLDEFDLSDEGQGSMAGATPTASEIAIACQRAKANIKNKCHSICAENANSTDPNVRSFSDGEMATYGECQTVPDANNNVVKAFRGGKCECCD